MGEYVGVKRLDVFIPYMSAKFIERETEKTYRVYITDHLRALCGSHNRWIELISPRPDFDPDEIAADIIERAGLVIT